MRAKGFKTWSVSLPRLCRLWVRLFGPHYVCYSFFFCLFWHSVQFLPQGVLLLSMTAIIPMGGFMNQSSASTKLCITIFYCSNSSSGCSVHQLLIIFIFTSSKSPNHPSLPSKISVCGILSSPVVFFPLPPPACLLLFLTFSKPDNINTFRRQAPVIGWLDLTWDWMCLCTFLWTIVKGGRCWLATCLWTSFLLKPRG